MSPEDTSEPSEKLKQPNATNSDSDATLIASSGSSSNADGESTWPISTDFQLPAIGSKIGKYELKEKLGSGGMSVVYKAHDPVLDRYVALKLLLPQAGAKSIDTMRFHQEAKAASRLEHPNIVKVHDFNVTEDGVPYLTMSFLDGISLADVIKKEGGLQPGRWLSIMVQACDALACAHENNVVHRDIKPSNFVLCDEKGNEVLKLVDFGIAKIESNDQQALTKTGEVFGSPLYMSPEQCAGSKVDSRSDVYSLGCVMYEALAGKPPLSGENTVATIVKHLQEKPIPLTKVCGKISNIESINSVVMKCLEKKPEDRYPDTQALRKELESLFLGRKVKGSDKTKRNQLLAVGAMIFLGAGFFAFQQYAKIDAENKQKLAAEQKQKSYLRSRALYKRSQIHWSEKKFEDARAELRAALELAKKTDAPTLYIAGLNLQNGNAELHFYNHSLAVKYFMDVVNAPLPEHDNVAQDFKYNAYFKVAAEDEMLQRNPESAIRNYLKALEYARMLNRVKDSVYVLMKVSVLEDRLGHKDKSRDYFLQAQKLGEEDERGAASAMEEFAISKESYSFKDDAIASIAIMRKHTEERQRAKEERRAREREKKEEKSRLGDVKAEKIKKDWAPFLLEK